MSSMENFHRQSIVFIAVTVMFITLAWFSFTQASSQTAIVKGGAERTCQACHTEPMYGKEFFNSVHGNNGCKSCHTGIREFRKHMAGDEKSVIAPCGDCHGEIATKFRNDYHYLRQNMQCSDCHSNIHGLKKREEKLKIAATDSCIGCHSKDEYAALGHSASVLKGNMDSASCIDCHSLHGTPYFLDDKRGKARERIYFTGKCVSCHGNAELMKRNNIETNSVASYEETHHGKVALIGYPELVAGCADCHTGHNVLPKSDPRSPVNEANLIEKCRNCHQVFHPRFVSYLSHPDYAESTRYRTLYVSSLFMMGLLSSVFIFFGIHTILWWRRAYCDVCKKTDSPSPEATPSGWDENTPVRRFGITERLMHILLILSFLTLVATGMPLKYKEAPWADDLIHLLGGGYMAGRLHRTAAVILWALFFYTCWLSYKYLFPKEQGVKGWFGRLIGPESLFFNLKDWDDMKGMFRWFFNRGDMPRFDRWTYWEKFDFFAVFWGMTIIGLSGLMLWFPEMWSYIVPGWVLNVAELVHSEEALLAALFIFLMHFFHNHIVPNKFPLEPNIFTGRNSLKQFMDERPLEFERIIKEGRLESLRADQPSIWVRFLSSAVGFASLFIGLIMAALILWAILRG